MTGARRASMGPASVNGVGRVSTWPAKRQRGRSSLTGARASTGAVVRSGPGLAPDAHLPPSVSIRSSAFPCPITQTARRRAFPWASRSLPGGKSITPPRDVDAMIVTEAPSATWMSTSPPADEIEALPSRRSRSAMRTRPPRERKRKGARGLSTRNSPPAVSSSSDPGTAGSRDRPRGTARRVAASVGGHLELEVPFRPCQDVVAIAAMDLDRPRRGRYGHALRPPHAGSRCPPSIRRRSSCASPAAPEDGFPQGSRIRSAPISTLFAVLPGLLEDALGRAERIVDRAPHRLADLSEDVAHRLAEPGGPSTRSDGRSCSSRARSIRSPSSGDTFPSAISFRISIRACDMVEPPLGKAVTSRCRPAVQFTRLFLTLIRRIDRVRANPIIIPSESTAPGSRRLRPCPAIGGDFAETMSGMGPPLPSTLDGSCVSRQVFRRNVP